MARKTYMAWADTANPEDLDAAPKAVTIADVPGTEIEVPARAKSVALDVIVDAPGATTELILTMQSSRTKTYWAKHVALSAFTIVSDEAQTTASILAIKILGLGAGEARRIRLGIQESDFIQFGLRGDVAGGTVSVTATFFEEDT